MDSDDPNRTKRLKVTEVEKSPLKITIKLNTKSEPKPKRKSKPRPKSTGEGEPEPEPLSLPFFDSSTSPEEIKSTLDSKLDNIKSCLVSALNKIDESFACEVATNIEFFDHVKCNGGEKSDAEDPFIMKKTLEASDVGQLSRLMLKKQWLKNHILPFWELSRKLTFTQIPVCKVKIYDQDEQTVHELTLKRWGSNTCYIFNNNWIESFVSRRNLQKGDKMGLYWDSFYSHFCFAVLDQT